MFIEIGRRSRSKKLVRPFDVIPMTAELAFEFEKALQNRNWFSSFHTRPLIDQAHCSR